MAAVSKFRTSLGGFNREDVANYIEMTANEHLRQVRELEEDKAHLVAELEQVKAALAAAQAGAPAPAEPVPEPDYASEELEAYRRAEAAERNAAARAEKVHQQLTDLCESVSGGYNGCGEELCELCDALKQKLEQIQSVFDSAREKVDKLNSDNEA